MQLLETVADELSLMLDEGVTVTLTEGESGAFVLNLHIDLTACEDCLVPDETIAGIAEDALRRGGATVTAVQVVRAV
jgi:hypothetical protein